MLATRIGWGLSAMLVLCIGVGTGCRASQEGATVKEPYHPKQPIVVKFVEGLSVSRASGAFTVAPAEGAKSPVAAAEIDPSLTELNRLLADETVHPMFEDGAKGLMPEGKPLAGRDLRLYYVVTILEGTPRATTDALVAALDANPLVETCYVGPVPVPAGGPPPPGGVPGR